MNFRAQPTRQPFGRPRLVLLIPLLISVPWLFGAKPTKVEVRELKRDKVTEKSKKQSFDTKGGKDVPTDSQSRTLAKVRERLEVTDDDEWALISERILRVEEVRRSVGSSSGRGGPSLGDKDKRGPRPSSAGPSEQESLRAALGDNLPDAEIKLRLARARDVHLQNEAKLAKAQSELRSVLTIRQEALAVVAGLLPP
jgi:hypothetical protein